MLKLSEARKPEKEGKAREADKGGEREERVEDHDREDCGRPEQAWRVFNLTTPPPTPEFSQLGRDPTPIEFGHQLVKLLLLHTSF